MFYQYAQTLIFIKSAVGKFILVWMILLNAIIESLHELCEGSYDTYKFYYADRDYTNNYMPFENPLINIQVVSQDIAVKSSHWCERAFKKKQEKLNEVDNPLHNNHST